jgi:hypothetical protein
VAPITRTSRALEVLVSTLPSALVVRLEMVMLLSLSIEKEICTWGDAFR